MIMRTSPKVGHLLFALAMVGVPTLGALLSVCLLVAHGTVSLVSIGLFFVFYVASAFGVEVGFHRYFSHRSFKARAGFRRALGAMGSIAGQGPVLYWAALHRLHHRHTDLEKDPHSPVARTKRGFWHAHTGWMFETRTIDFAKLVPDLVRDDVTVSINARYWRYYLAGLIIPAAVGGFAGGPFGAFEGFLWGGLLRIFVNHHVTWSINSFCHLYGRRPFETRDNSRNLAVLALPSMGGSWHNNHHAFPASASNDYLWWQIDPGAWFVRAAVKLDLAWAMVDRSRELRGTRRRT